MGNAIDVLATTEGEAWMNHTEDLILHVDALMFPRERHAIFSGADITGHITYQKEKEAYFFNSTGYFAWLKTDITEEHLTPVASFYEVKRRAVILASYAVRMRAWEHYHVPMRTLPSVLRNADIPWEVKVKLRKHKRVAEFSDLSRGALSTLMRGRVASQNLDLVIISTLANHAYRNSMPIEWLRPFILT